MGFPMDRRAAWLVIAVFLIGGLLATVWQWTPTGISDFYFVRQDVPIACAMLAAAAAFPYLRFGQSWQKAIEFSPRVALIGCTLIVAVGVAGNWLVMFGYDLSRDQAMASFAAEQIARGTLITPVPEEWQPFGRAMFPLYFYGGLNPNLAWASAYLPVNSAMLAVGKMIGQPAVINPLLLAIGLAALWNAARRVWPSRRDAAVVTVLVCATSSQLIVNAMTSFAMVGHFALNMVWLAFFLRNDRVGVVGALLVAALAMGLHQFHFHPMFAAPFVLWLAYRRQWLSFGIYTVGYCMLVWFWMRWFPVWLISQADPSAVVRGGGADLWAYIAGRFGRLFDYSARVWLFNLMRFFTWQNVALLILSAAAWPAFFTKEGRGNGLIVPILGACAIGLAVMVFQGQGFGYRYLSGVIGCFGLLAGYGWIRLAREPEAGRPWAMIKAACCFTLVVTLPIQLAMARHMVAPYARLHHAVLRADADVVLVDSEGGFLAQDLVQNRPDFTHRPKMMDLAMIPADALERLCLSKRVMLIDNAHYRAVGMREGRIAPQVRKHLGEQRAILGRLACAPPMPLDV